MENKEDKSTNVSTKKNLTNDIRFISQVPYFIELNRKKIEKLETYRKQIKDDIDKLLYQKTETEASLISIIKREKRILHLENLKT